jgi:hypothetical protein
VLLEVAGLPVAADQCAECGVGVESLRNSKSTKDAQGHMRVALRVHRTRVAARYDDCSSSPDGLAYNDTMQ